MPGERLGTIEPGSPAPQIPGETARRHLVSLDKDRSGLLEGDEYERGGGATVDDDGDGRISLSELAEVAGLTGERNRTAVAEASQDSPFLVTRVDVDGDLSRLLDGLDPWAFDGDDDDRLDRSEIERGAVRRTADRPDDSIEIAEFPSVLGMHAESRVRARQFARRDTGFEGDTACLHGGRQFVAQH